MLGVVGKVDWVLVTLGVVTIAHIKVVRVTGVFGVISKA